MVLLQRVPAPGGTRGRGPEKKSERDAELSAIYGFPVCGFELTRIDRSRWRIDIGKADKQAMWLNRRFVLAMRATEERRNRAEMTPGMLEELNLDLGATEVEAKTAAAAFALQQMERGLDDVGTRTTA